MSGRKHTPGPWECECNPFAHKWTVWANGDYLIATIHNNNFDPKNAANARLILAAPELLEALIALTSTIGSEEEDVEAHRLARAAIAKAKGEQA